MQSDLRAVLQYVPYFRGKIFVLTLNAARMSDLALAEAILDLIALQQVGVRLVLISTGNGDAQIAHRLIDGELKWQATDLRVEPVMEILDRGQLALIESAGLSSLDDVVLQLAVGLRAAKLITLIPKPREGGNAVSQEDAKNWRGVEEDLLHRAAEACERGIPRVHLLDEDHQGVLMDELFSNEGVGVMVYADDYLSIRGIEPEDIPELLAMIGRSMRDAHLVPRSYDQIEETLADFQVLTVDGNVVGCVALHPSEEPLCGEVACLYVKQSHGGEGYGHLLVKAAEDRAKELGLPWVFALSNRAANYFTEQLGYQPCEIQRIPEARQQKLRQSDRESTVIWKELG